MDHAVLLLGEQLSQTRDVCLVSEQDRAVVNQTISQSPSLVGALRSAGLGALQASAQGSSPAQLTQAQEET